MLSCDSNTIYEKGRDTELGAGAEYQTMETQLREPVISIREITEILPPLVDYGEQGVLWGDFNNDQHPDLVYMGHGRNPAVYKQEDGRFVDVVAESGIKLGDWTYPQQADRHGGSCADYDNDGNQDIFIGHGAMIGLTLGVKYDELLRGNGNFEFEDVSFATGVVNQHGRTRAGKWVDLNNDGWLDLYIGNFDSSNVLYLSNRDGTFTDATEQLNLGTNGFRSEWADFNNDGFLDVVQIAPLQLHLNKSGEYFEDVTEQYLGDAGIFGYGLAWADLDGDGDQDLLVSRLTMDGLLFRNDGDTFTPIEFSALGLNPQASITGFSPADMDNDGDLDVVMNTSSGIMIFENSGEVDYQLAHSSPRAVSIEKMRNGDISVEDFDGDGLLDVASDDPEGYKLYLNTTYQSGNWLRILFDGISNNRMGYGSKVEVTRPGGLKKITTEYLGAIAGMRSYGCQPLHIGVGFAESVSIKVTWSNGLVTELDDQPVNTAITISE